MQLPRVRTSYTVRPVVVVRSTWSGRELLLNLSVMRLELGLTVVQRNGGLDQLAKRSWPHCTVEWRARLPTDRSYAVARQPATRMAVRRPHARLGWQGHRRRSFQCCCLSRAPTHLRMRTATCRNEGPRHPCRRHHSGSVETASRRAPCDRDHLPGRQRLGPQQPTYSQTPSDRPPSLNQGSARLFSHQRLVLSLIHI